MRTLVKYVMIACVAMFAASLFLRDRLPPPSEIRRELLQSPLQVPIELPSFTVDKEGVRYTVTPRYSYDVFGLVTACHDSKSIVDISHEDWKDYLNSKDISIIWGANIETGDYRKMSFSQGDWTGYYEHREGVKFDVKLFSNNHLIPADERIARAIRDTRPGDQVHLKGYLVDYSHSNGSFKRISSITRNDTGNSACEVVYVTEYSILQAASRFWRITYYFAAIVGILCLLYLFLTLFFLTPRAK